MPSKPSLNWHEDHRGVSLECAHWKLRYDLLLGLFDLSSPAFPTFGVRWARARAQYQKNRRQCSVGTDDGPTPDWRVEPIQDARGPGLRLQVQSQSRRHPGLQFSATLYEQSPLLVLDLVLHNVLPHTIEVNALLPLEIDPEWGGRIALGQPIGGLYGAGWQSWSPAGWKPRQAFDLRTRFAPLSGPLLDAPAFPPLRAGHFRADMVGVLTPSGKGPALLAGLLTTADQFGALEAQLDPERTTVAFTCSTDGVLLAPDERLSSERLGLILAEAEQDPLSTYGQMLGQEMGVQVRAQAPRGWCSWTAFYLKMSEHDILRQITWLAEERARLPLEVIQIDDGWEQAVGDWEENERFHHGMGWLAEQIRQAGFVPGLWLAPFIVHPRSQLAATHPEWLVRNNRGRPASAGLGWGAICHALDVTLPEVQEWLRRLISTASERWGYSYLKLDFLYAAAIPGQRHRNHLTRAQILRQGLDILRQAAGPDCFMLGCGCPLGPAIGIVDGMRVSADVAAHWHPRWGPFTPLVRGEPVIPAMVNAVRNNVAQAWMHRRLWLNDPDALVLRESDSRLTAAECRSLSTVVALSGGIWMMGDDLPKLEPERQSMAAKTIPLHRGQPQVLDVLTEEMPAQILLERSGPWGQGWTAALFNWDDKPADLSLDLSTLGLAPETLCHLYESWTGVYQQVRSRVQFPAVAPHDCRVFMLQPLQKQPQWVGSSLHLVQGMAILDWQIGQGQLVLRLDPQRVVTGDVLLWLPQQAPRDIEVQGGTAEVEALQAGLWCLHLAVEKACQINIPLETV